MKTIKDWLLKHPLWASVAILVLLAILSAVVSYLDTHQISSLQKENEELKVQLAHARINSPITYDTINDTVAVATIPVTVVSRSDYKKELADKRLLEETDIPPNDVEEQYTMATGISDSVRMYRKADIFRFHDRWADFTLSLPDTLLSYSVRDSVVCFITRIPRHHFLWWHWGTKGYEVKIRNFNPNSTVKHAQFVKITKD